MPIWHAGTMPRGSKTGRVKRPPASAMLWFWVVWTSHRQRIPPPGNVLPCDSRAHWRWVHGRAQVSDTSRTPEERMKIGNVGLALIAVFLYAVMALEILLQTRPYPGV